MTNSESQALVYYGCSVYVISIEQAASHYNAYVYPLYHEEQKHQFTTVAKIYSQETALNMALAYANSSIRDLVEDGTF